MKNLLIEPFIGSLGILIFGVVSIQFAGSLVGVQMTSMQSFGMSLIFFVARFIWLAILRFYFGGKYETIKR